ncbi:GntR family transcriptional regulator [Peribacillus sp. NPDC006672]|uniref:GntR family transcriptional regulator n=1 Tax=Peribacillus sp. NPDC006672 TaxID=3390606 RepID=UPI003D05DD37
MIQKDSPSPIYLQLEEEIEAVQSFELVPGVMIPSEKEYTEKYGIRRMKVRQAISNLVNGGYLYRWRGKGTGAAFAWIGCTFFQRNVPGFGLIKTEKKPSKKVLKGFLAGEKINLFFHNRRFLLTHLCV